MKAFKWATWRLQDKKKGIIAFESNNGFLENMAFDGMRKHLKKDIDKLLVVDLGGNVRKNQKGSHNVFEIRVGVSVIFLIKGNQDASQC